MSSKKACQVPYLQAAKQRAVQVQVQSRTVSLFSVAERRSQCRVLQRLILWGLRSEGREYVIESKQTWHTSGNLVRTKIRDKIKHGGHSTKSRGHTWLGYRISYVRIKSPSGCSTQFVHCLTKDKSAGAHSCKAAPQPFQLQHLVTQQLFLLKRMPGGLR